MDSCLLWQLSLQSKVALQLVELYEMSRPTLVIISLESGLKWLNYGQLKPMAVVFWNRVLKLQHIKVAPICSTISEN